MALLMVLFALPVGITFYKFVTQTMKTSMQEKRQKTAAEIANDVIMDYMRQFSQSPSGDHYALDTLERPQTFYSSGFSTVTVIPDSINRTVYLKAQGSYGTQSKPLARKTLEALIQFASDITQYGTMLNGPFTISASNVTYDGGLWFNGNLKVTGSNVRFRGGPLVVNGNVTAPASAVLDGDLYYSGGSAGNLTVLGMKYNFTPPTSWPVLDFNYYDAHYTYKTTSNRTVIFNSTGTFTVVGVGMYPIPAAGAIIYGENCNLTIRGIVSGRVTAVAYGAIGSGTQGNITVNDNLYYAGASSIAASAQCSFAAMARNSIAFSKTGADLLVAGVYFVEQGTSNMSMTGSTGRIFRLYGVRTQGISVSGFTGGRELHYDANLRSFPPPGLPERALLVNWKLH
ncbi:MAG: hypothetical protein ABIG11_08320 [bacterium]